MAIADIVGYSHLSRADIEALGAELDAIRLGVEQSRGARDARYIHQTIRFQRSLEVTARAALLLGRSRTTRCLGVAGLTFAKIVENMELGHNIGHGQWDWMNDPEIHSTTWEWDMVATSSQWRYAHNYRHHLYTNVLGMDEDIGFGVLRVTRDQPWCVRYLFQPVQSLVLALTFEWGIALYDLDAAVRRTDGPVAKREALSSFLSKVRRQVVKDYVLFPALAGRRWRQVLGAATLANALRSLWLYVVIICGHLADGAEKFTPESIDGETRPQWYLRQLLGTANVTAGPVLAFSTGHLCYQIEHHLFPDLPSNRYRDIAEQVKTLCDKYDLPYNTGSLGRQFILAQRTVLKLSAPNRLLTATSDDAPETASERRFSGGTRPVAGQGLRTALRELRDRRPPPYRSAA